MTATSGMPKRRVGLQSMDVKAKWSRRFPSATERRLPVDGTDETAIRRIRGLRGVQRAEFLDSADRKELRARATSEAAENGGMLEVLSRMRAVCLFKDPTFRPPPEPTVLLVDGARNILGRELVAGESPPAERRVAFLGKDFVLYAGARPSGSYRFLLPPVRFPELESIVGVARVVSASPDTPQDEYLRIRHGIAPGSELASVLVGYDLRNP